MKSFPLYHGEGVSNCGVFIKSPEGRKMIYATDFQRIDYKFDKLGINTFLVECNHMDDIAEDDNEGRYSHVLSDHSSISTVCEFLRVNQTEELKNVIICHLSSDNADEGEMRNQVKKVVGNKVNVFIAKKGLEVEL